MTTVRANEERSRYEIDDDGRLAAFAEYTLHGTLADFTHTETVDGFEGRGLASRLVQGALDDVRARGWQLRPSCPFVRKFLGEHAEYVDLVPEEDRVEFGLRG